MITDGDVVRTAPGAEFVRTRDGRLFGRGPAGPFEIHGLDDGAVRAILAITGAGASPEAIVRRLFARHAPGTVMAFLENYRGFLFDVEPSARVAAARDASERRVGVLGSGGLAALVMAALGDASYSKVGMAGTVSEPAIEKADVVVCALDGVPVASVLDAAAALMDRAVPFVAVIPHPGSVTVGPTVVPGATPCVECAVLSLVYGRELLDSDDAIALAEAAREFTAPRLDVDAAARALAARAVTEAVAEVRALTSDPPGPRLAARTVTLGPGDLRQDAGLVAVAGCSTCGGDLSRETHEDPVGWRATAANLVAEDLDFPRRLFVREAREELPIRTVGILGGGTAGYLAALGLRRRLPELQVTLIESSKIPVIGVGEASTPRLIEFLHSRRGLGLDVLAFHRRVQPVWKLGVHYDWGPPGKDPFPWPFQYGAIGDAVHYEQSLGSHCLGAELMNAKKVPIVDIGDGRHFSLMSHVPFAYHLDNPRFVRYLREEALAAGITYRDAVVADATLKSDGAEIEALVTEDGQRLSFDLYVDCSGFRSALLEKKLGSGFSSYADSLFTDSAVMANVPHGGVVKPYTVAESMDNGWCWNIAFEESDHRGYVFASAYSTPEEAAAEMRRKNPGMGDWWSLKFRSGRHDDWWKGNVVALGNAFAFMEPLGSTALHMLVNGIDVLTRSIPWVRGEASKAELSRAVCASWDQIRGWLAVQYRFNRRLDTPFWQECAQSVELGAAESRVARYRERAPLADMASTESTYFGEDYSYDIVLAGQEVPARWAPPTVTAAERERTVRRMRTTARRAINQVDALELVRTRRPDILVDLVDDPEGWVQQVRY